MIGRDAIDDEVWGMIFAAQAELNKLMPRLANVPPDVAEDCISDGVLDLAEAFDPFEIRRNAKLAGVSWDKQIFFALKNLASRRISRAKYHMAKSVSDDTPIGEDDGDLRLRDLFVQPSNSAERIENYAEWMMFARKGGCPLSEEEIVALFGLNPEPCK